MLRIYLVLVLGALEALQCIICHYLQTDGIMDRITDRIMDGIMDGIMD